ncbi:MAG: hypothetical protein IJ557_02530 [Bacteroidaceae bacterium]|nr:hypothetical protein [Bacteroidaceae bacterium]
MGRKKLYYLPLFVNDFTSDEKLRRCDASTWGVYIYLMCIMHKSDVYGVFDLGRQEVNRRKRETLVNKVINAPDVLRQMRPFAKMLRSQMPWEQDDICKALEELMYHGIIELHVTTSSAVILQPRMFREGGGVLPNETSQPIGSNPSAHDINDEENDLKKNKNKRANKSAKKTSLKKQNKSKIKDENSSRERTPAIRLEWSKSDNINNNVVVEDEDVEEREKKKPVEKKLTRAQGVTELLVQEFDTFWGLYRKNVGRERCWEIWRTLAPDERARILRHVPAYRESQSNVRFIKNPETYLSRRAWEDEIIKESELPRPITPHGEQRTSGDAPTDNGAVHSDNASAVPRKYSDTL